jgi:hypothetical protein
MTKETISQQLLPQPEFYTVFWLSDCLEEDSCRSLIIIIIIFSIPIIKPMKKVENKEIF